MQEIIEKLIKGKKTISTMESCTGGHIVDAITNIPGSSEVLKFSAITYSNEYKIKMGVQKETIEKYTVYSQKVAQEMSLAIAKYTNSNYGIGITGKLNRTDINNPYGKDNIVYISIYDKDKEKYYNSTIECIKESRKDNKDTILKQLIFLLRGII